MSVAVARLKGDCKVCQAAERIRLAVNNAVWEGEPSIDSRRDGYRAGGVRAAAVHELDLDPKTITRHAEHVEADARFVSTPADLDEDRNEEPVLTDFASVTGLAAELGMRAMTRLTRSLDALGPKELIQTAKLGLGAAGVAEAARLKRGDQTIQVAALFGVVGGYVTTDEDAIEGEAVEVESLRASIAEERRELKALAAGDVSRETFDDPPPLP